MTFVVDFIIGIIGRICNSIISTYIVRPLDKVKEYKNNRRAE